MYLYIFAAISGLILMFSPATLSGDTAIAPAVEPTGTVEAALETYEVWVTAYSSTLEETDSTPFTTAMNSEVRDGIVAANFLPFGTTLQIPERFGDKIFIVEDRMHRRKTNFVDIWMPTKTEAEHFGITYTTIVVLERGHEIVAAAE